MSIENTADITCSVCIANYNGIGLIDACIESVKQQTCSASLEIIVHDDASSDGSAEHIQRNYPEIRLIASNENVGFCTANNRMAEASHGKYLLLLNNDATLFPDAIACLLEEAERQKHPAILGLPQYAAGTGELLDIGMLLDPFFNTVPNRDPLRNNVAMIPGACLWVHKALWEKLGGFPEWFDSIGEDLYLCCRARLAGYPVKSLSHSGYRHKVGASFGGGKLSMNRLVSTFRRRGLSERNKTFVMAMTCPWPVLPFLLPLHLLLLLLEGTLLSLLKQDRRYLLIIYLPALKALLGNRNSVISIRRSIMAQRQIGSVTFFSEFDPVPYKLRMLLRHGLPHLG